MSKKSITTICKEEGIEFIDFRAILIDSNTIHFTYNLKAAQEILKKGKLEVEIENKNISLKIDESSAFVDPFNADATLVVYTYLENNYCVRSLLNSNNKNMKLFVEFEFFVFDEVRFSSNNLTSFYKIMDEESKDSSSKEFDFAYNHGHRSYIDNLELTPPNDTMSDIRNEMAKIVLDTDINLVYISKGAGANKSKVRIEADNLLRLADDFEKMKYIIKTVAHLNGKTATFMPKPLSFENGLSLKIGFGKDISKELVSMSKYLFAFSMPNTNSYRRFADTNFPTMPTIGEDTSHIVYKHSGYAVMNYANSSASMHLLLSTIAICMKEKISEESIRLMPSFTEALNEIHKSAFLHDAMPEGMLKGYIDVKIETQLKPISSAPHPSEFINTFAC